MRHRAARGVSPENRATIDTALYQEPCNGDIVRLGASALRSRRQPPLPRGHPRVPTTSRRHRVLYAAECSTTMFPSPLASSPSWISRTRSSGVMKRRSWVTTTQVVPERFLEAAEDRVDLVAGLRIELAGRLVGEQQDRLLDEGPGDRHSLLLAAGKLVRAVIEPVFEADLASAARRPAAAVPGDMPLGMNGTRTFSSAVRLLIRLND